MPTTVRITPILSSTIAAFKPALSLTPITSTTVTAAVIKTAGRLSQAMTVCPSASVDGLEHERALADVVIPGCRPEPRVELDVKDVVQERVEVIGPAGGDDAGADGVLEDQVPADDPGDKLAQGRVSVGVGAAGHRHHAGQLRIAERREAAADGGQQKREDERRAGEFVGDEAGLNIEPRTDRGADA